MQSSSTILIGGVLLSLAGPAPLLAPAVPGSAPLRIAANDNRQPAGSYRDGRLELRLDVVNGQWFPEAEDGPSVTMQAFAEEGRAPEVPGPMIRVHEGTTPHTPCHNSLPDSEVVVHGLHARPATSDDVLRIPAGATREVTFQAGTPGTYYYWGTSTKKPLSFRVGKDSQLSGAIIVDPVGAA